MAVNTGGDFPPFDIDPHSTLDFTVSYPKTPVEITAPDSTLLNH